MHKRNKLAPALASDSDILASSDVRRARTGRHADDMGLTDTPLSGTSEPLDPGAHRDPHPSDPSIRTRENVQDFVVPEGIEGSEGFERGLSGDQARARAWTSNTPGPNAKPFDPFSPFDRQPSSPPVGHPRLRVDLGAGFDPHRLGVDLWRQLDTTNHEVPLLYIAAGRPVRLECIDHAARMVDLNRDRLGHEVHRIARFIQPTANGFVDVPAPSRLIADMLAMPARHIPLPPLRGIASAPFVAPDGELIVGAGYHPTVATFLDFRDPLPPVRRSPTATDVRRAMDMLNEPLVDFPFADAAGRALALVVMLLPFVRRHIDGPTPLHLIEKATPGTGATLLIDVLLSPALGANIAKTSAPASDVEWFYSTHALLRDLPQAVIIDNARELTSKELAKALTDTVLVSRVVSTGSTATIPVQCVWLATGNNVTLHQEIARRIVRCRLDAEMERPWRDRQFRIPNLRQWLREHRTQCIWACLTLIRSWFVAGCRSGSKSLGMYENYSAVMGGILEHLNVGSYPTDDMLPDATEDLQSEAESWFVSGWWAGHRDQPVQVANLLAIAIDEGSIVVEYWGGVPSSGAAKLGHFLRSMLGKTFSVPASHTTAATTVVVRRLTNDPVTRRARYQLVVRSTR